MSNLPIVPNDIGGEKLTNNLPSIVKDGKFR